MRKKQIYLWLGKVNSEKSYNEYFNQEDGICLFCKDIGIEEYDEDLIGILPLSEKYMSINGALDQTPINHKEYSEAFEKCLQLHLEEINAIVFYTKSPYEDISTPNNITLEGLHYIGLFNI